MACKRTNWLEIATGSQTEHTFRNFNRLRALIDADIFPDLTIQIPSMMTFIGGPSKNRLLRGIISKASLAASKTSHVLCNLHIARTTAKTQTRFWLPIVYDQGRERTATKVTRFVTGLPANCYLQWLAPSSHRQACFQGFWVHSQIFCASSWRIMGVSIASPTFSSYGCLLDFKLQCTLIDHNWWLSWKA